MARQDIPALAGRRIGIGSIGWRWDTSRPEIDSGLTGPLSVYLREFTVTTQGQINLSFDNASSGADSRADLTDTWESSGGVDIITGGTIYSFDINTSDISDNYSWLPANSADSQALYIFLVGNPTAPGLIHLRDEAGARQTNTQTIEVNPTGGHPNRASYRSSVNNKGWNWLATNRVAIDRVLRGVNTIYLARLLFWNTGRGVELSFDIARSFEDGSRYDLSSTFEQVGGIDFTISDTTYSFDLNGADTSDVYVWNPSNTADVAAVLTAISSTTIATLVIRDGPLPPPTTALSALKIGGSDVTAVYLGTTAITEMYLGTARII